MTKDELLERISINPNICFGKPCIRGLRIWVSLILDLLASGLSVSEVVKNYPGLAAEDVLVSVVFEVAADAAPSRRA